MTGYAYAPNYWDAGWIPLPLPHGAKTPPPSGTTGRGARETSRADVQTWLDENPDANIALRLPKNVVGLDFDLYKEAGRESFRTMIQQHGPLPATWRSTSREDGSGILFYRTDPERTDALRDPVGGGKGGLEIIRWSHRYAVVAPSLHPEGRHYVWIGPDGHAGPAPRVDQLPELPATWLEALTPAARAEHSAATVASTAEGLANASAYERSAVTGLIERLRAMSTAATANPGDYRGEPWDQTTYYVACRLFEIANADWSELDHDGVRTIVLEFAPRDAGFPDERVEEKLASAERTTAGKAAAPPTGIRRTDDSGLFRNAPSREIGSPATIGRVIAHDLEIDVTNHALAADWLRTELGTGPLAGVFLRKGELVYTPRIGAEGYIAPRDERAEAHSAASITVLTEHDLQARIQHRYNVTKLAVDREATKAAKAIDPDAGEVMRPKPAIFPLESAKVVARAADDAPNLRELHGVVHAPTFRPDGSLITQHGYDAATGLLFLPTKHQPGAIEDEPSAESVRLAVKWVDYMLQDFRFVSLDDRATYIGLMLTPLLRTIVPSPYKLGVIEAHQPGSGKTFLARALCTIHGGVLHPELPATEEEIAKVIGSVLDTQTAPVVGFDNVTGLVRSSTLAGVLTSPTFQGRRLGSSTVIEADNDRLWLITANNAALGGDLGRRNVRVRLDPGVPNPELRTQFAISNFEGWVRQHRGDLLWALLVLVRHWIVRGRPFVDEPTQDSYGMWTSTLRGILATAGMPGIFGGSAVEVEMDPEQEEWGGLLERIYDLMGEEAWTAKKLLSLVAGPNAPEGFPGKPIPNDALPGELARRGALEPTSLATSFGRYLLNRRGRWYKDLSVKQASRDKNHVYWKVERYKPPTTS